MQLTDDRADDIKQNRELALHYGQYVGQHFRFVAGKLLAQRLHALFVFTRQTQQLRLQQFADQQVLQTEQNRRRVSRVEQSRAAEAVDAQVIPCNGRAWRSV